MRRSTLAASFVATQLILTLGSALVSGQEDEEPPVIATMDGEYGTDGDDTEPLPADGKQLTRRRIVEPTTLELADPLDLLPYSLSNLSIQIPPSEDPRNVRNVVLTYQYVNRVFDLYGNFMVQVKADPSVNVDFRTPIQSTVMVRCLKVDFQGGQAVYELIKPPPFLARTRLVVFSDPESRGYRGKGRLLYFDSGYNRALTGISRLD